MFKNIVWKKKKNEKQHLAIIECQAIIYVFDSFVHKKSLNICM